MPDSSIQCGRHESVQIPGLVTNQLGRPVYVTLGCFVLAFAAGVRPLARPQPPQQPPTFQRDWTKGRAPVCDRAASNRRHAGHRGTNADRRAVAGAVRQQPDRKFTVDAAVARSATGPVSADAGGHARRSANRAPGEIRTPLTGLDDRSTRSGIACLTIPGCGLSIAWSISSTPP